MFLFFILVQHFYYKNEFLKMSMARKIFEYCCMIIKTFELLKSLYNLGARKFGIIGVPPVGCCPSQRIHNITRGCFEIENTFALAFHSSLDTLLKKLSCKLSGMKYSLGNSYEMTMNVIQHPQLFSKYKIKTLTTHYSL